MTTTYRKTATIEATQWFKMGDHPAVVLKSDPNRYADEGIPWCPTMEGGHVVTPGDWIATGIKGEHWPIKPDVFAETYTPVDAALSTPATEPQPAPSDKIAEAARVLFTLEWMAGARPPMHPEPMLGSQSFGSLEEAVAFFKKRPSDSTFVSLTKTTSTQSDVSAAALRALAGKGE